MKNVGVVDAQYVVHFGLPTLGITVENEASDLLLLGLNTIPRHISPPNL